MMFDMAPLLWGNAVYLTTWANHVAADTENDATISASSTNGTNSPWKSHDGSSGTSWVSNGVGAGQWIQVQFQSPRMVTAFTVRFNNGGSGIYFTGRLDGSNNGSSWTQVGSNINATSSVSLTDSQTLGAPVLYLYFRITGTFVQNDFAADTATRVEEWSFTFRSA